MLLSKKLPAVIVLLALTTSSGFASKSTRHRRSNPDNSIAGRYDGRVALHDGPYAGAEVGYSSYIATQQQYTTNSDGGTTSYINRMGAQAWHERFLVGYGQYFCGPYYLGGELFGQINNTANAQATLPDSSTSTSVFTSLKAHRTYGIAILPGLRLTDTALAYLRFGYNSTNFIYKADVNIIPGETGGSTTRNKTSGGFAFGVGMESLIYDQLSLRGEFTHTRYQSFGTPNFSTSVDDTTLSYNISPSVNEYSIGLIYHFV